MGKNQGMYVLRSIRKNITDPLLYYYSTCPCLEKWNKDIYQQGYNRDDEKE
jgi:hypothetical protein